MVKKREISFGKNVTIFYQLEKNGAIYSFHVLFYPYRTITDKEIDEAILHVIGDKIYRAWS